MTTTMRQNRIGPGAAVPIAAIGALFCFATPAVQAGKAIDDVLVRELLVHAAQLSGRTIAGELRPPVLIPVTARVIGERVCPEDPRRCHRIAAAYSVINRDIIYRDDLDLTKPPGRSVLVHELTHFLQHLELDSRLNATCQMILYSERQAYNVQRMYLASEGYPVSMLTPIRLAGCRDNPQ